MSPYAIEKRGGEFLITTPNGGWETRNLYTGKLTDFSIDPELDYVDFREMEQELQKLVQEERNQPQKP